MERSQLAIVWDWDWSAVNENTDVFVPNFLSSGLLQVIREGTAAGTQWTRLMHEVAGLLHSRGFREADIATALRALPVFPEVPTAFREATGAGALQYVVSDANQVYITVMAEHMGVSHTIRQIITNGASYDSDGRLHIRPYVDPSAPHSCGRCPVNLCKGQAIDALALSHAIAQVGDETIDVSRSRPEGPIGRSVSRVLYVGDGSGDLCACLRLGPEDVIAARSGPSFALLKHLNSPELSGHVRATVKPWTDGAELLAIIRQFLQQT